MDALDRLIVALDVPTAEDARNLISSLGESVRFYKVGKQLFTALGPDFVRELRASNRKVFLDLKYKDIPNTVAGAVAEAAKLGVSMITVHASGGSKMLKAAAEAAAASESKPMILGVTVLTSMSQEDLVEIGVAEPMEKQVVRLARLAVNAGCGGVVASAMEARALRTELGKDFAIVTPGVRLAGGEKGDQARVVTPRDAIAAGATHLVVGRPITEADSPVMAAKTFAAAISS
jgi:orotidine-5'-phosphate decarboxylase